MQSVLRALVIYGFLLVLLRGFGKRTLAQITTFDLVLLLIIGEATQQALLGDDFSLTTSMLVILTLVGAEVGIDNVKQRRPSLGSTLEGLPLVLVVDGQALEERLTKSRIDVSDILEAARKLHGLERLDQVRYAVLERDGVISVIPR